MCVSYSMFFSLLAIIQVLQCVFLLFHVFTVFPHISGPTVCTSHSASFSMFLAIFQVKEYLFLIFYLFQFSCHVTGPTVCISHFSGFSVFLAIFQFLLCEFLIFLICQLSCHIPGPTVRVCLIFHVFQCFSPYSRSNSVCVSFSTFFSFLAIFLVLQCAFLILHIFQFSRHIAGPTIIVSLLPRFSVIPPYSRSYNVCVSHIPRFFILMAIIRVLQCVFLFFHVFHCFSTYSRSYSLYLSFCKFFNVSSDIPGQTVFVSHFLPFSVFLPYSRSYSVHFTFSTFFSFLAIFQVLQCVFLIFHDFQFSRHSPGPTVLFISHFLRF